MSATSIETAAPGRQIRGPSALGGDFRRFVNLTRTLAVTDFKLKFFGSVLGYLWQLMRPLMLFGILYAVFTHVVKLGSGVRFYPVVLLSGIVLFTFVSESTGGSVGSLVDRESLVRKVHFPRLVIPLAVVLTAYFNLLLNLIAVFVFMVASGVTPTWRWVELPPILLFLGVAATGVAMILSAAYVRFRDVRPIWDVALQLLFYASPVLYPIEKIGNDHLERAMMMLNPLAAALQQFRHAVLDPSAPSAAAAAGGAQYLLVTLAIVIALFGLGFMYFNREAPLIAEEL
ncbi:MAG: ABC transporter permease [Thermoleophilaceae bacterium]|nr:ABC transporter permease [Thermoleophilaceae bacterium]